MENIFSHEFNEFSGELLTTALNCLEVERRQKNAEDMAKNGSKSSQKTANGFSTIITSIVTFINGGSLSGTGKSIHESHYFKKFEFSRQKIICAFPHLSQKYATKGLVI